MDKDQEERSSLLLSIAAFAHAYTCWFYSILCIAFRKLKTSPPPPPQQQQSSPPPIKKKHKRSKIKVLRSRHTTPSITSSTDTTQKKKNAIKRILRSAFTRKDRSKQDDACSISTTGYLEEIPRTRKRDIFKKLRSRKK